MINNLDQNENNLVLGEIIDAVQTHLHDDKRAQLIVPKYLNKTRMIKFIPNKSTDEKKEEDLIPEQETLEMINLNTHSDNTLIEMMRNELTQQIEIAERKTVHQNGEQNDIEQVSSQMLDGNHDEMP